MQNLIASYRKAQQTANELYFELKNIQDGFLYITQVQCYGSNSFYLKNNAFVVQELCNEYDGDVFTNNPDHGIETYGTVTVLTKEQIASEMMPETVKTEDYLLDYKIRAVMRRWHDKHQQG